MERSATRLGEANRLRTIKVVHTIIWAFFAACIIAIPIAAVNGRFGWATALSGIVFVEVAVLLLNRWHCPLTPIAAQYTDDRRDNFDIYLPERLARYNKVIFGLLYAFGVALTAILWIT